MAETYEGEEKKDRDVYDEETRNKLAEDAEITPREEGFMEGYDEGDKSSNCPKCGTVIVEKENVVEREIDGGHYMFCSENCAENFRPGK